MSHKTPKSRINTKFSIILTSDLEKELLFAIDEGKKGLVSTQPEMDKKVSEWLKEK
jgi:hypothetical protein